MSKCLMVVLIGAVIFSLTGVVFAQEENMEYSYGTVVSVDAAKNEIVVKEYDLDTNAELTVTYLVAPQVRLENVGALKDITPGAEVDIEYQMSGEGKKTANFISVYVAPEPKALPEENMPQPMPGEPAPATSAEPSAPAEQGQPAVGLPSESVPNAPIAE